jgi:hypothetical protein
MHLRYFLREATFRSVSTCNPPIVKRGIGGNVAKKSGEVFETTGVQSVSLLRQNSYYSSFAEISFAPGPPAVCYYLSVSQVLLFVSANGTLWPHQVWFVIIGGNLVTEIAAIIEVEQ